MTNEQKIKETLLNNEDFKKTRNYKVFKEEKFRWEYLSWLVAQYCPQHFDSNKFNWKNDSSSIPKYCPQHLDPEKYNWENDSWSVIKHCPQKLDINKANLENIINNFPQYNNMSLKEIKDYAILNSI